MHAHSSTPSGPAPSSTAISPPRWLPWLIAAVPVVPFFYLVAFAALGSLRRLPLFARWILFYFAASQIVAALFTPNPLLSLSFAGIRTLEILAMIAAGVYLQDSRHLRPLLWGEVVIFLTAWGYSLYTQGMAGIMARLSHPYYYTVSLGLLAVIALWLIMFWRGGAIWWRVAAGLLAIATLLAAGSRGPTLALVVGSVAALLLARGRGIRRWVLIPLGVVAAAIFAVNTLKLKITPILRLLDDQTSGRNFVWDDAYAAWQTSPIGGVGAYQGGPYLTYLFKGGCQLNPILTANQIQCPEWLSSFSGMWLIAHNAWLQWLMETGVIGLSGLLLVYGYGLWAAAKSRDPLLIAALFGYTAMNFVDVVIAVPSPHFAELWWVTLGISVWRLEGATIRRKSPVEPRKAS
ncbi:O-antigen ligase family protein [Deinococcus psychrotolerans]|uniref:O-antigen ligase family protein n=1 Tax=Deinococcus psychrotolerans TaxID=2489213 RepID=A0A3G8YFP5_9DEIO|nr:O-antigen ligase family protein [Deinococcus psychrotolerans]